jgi:hypothetical protein
LAYKRKGRGGLKPTNHNTPEHKMPGCYPPGGLNLSKTLVSLMFPSISTLVSTPILNHCHKPRQLAPSVWPTRFIYVRSMAFISTSKFLPGSRLVFRSLLFITDKIRDLSLKEPESRENARSNTDRFPPSPAQAGLACEARLGHKSSRLGESKLDPTGDIVDHNKHVALTL